MTLMDEVPAWETDQLARARLLGSFCTYFIRGRWGVSYRVHDGLRAVQRATDELRWWLENRPDFISETHPILQLVYRMTDEDAAKVARRLNRISDVAVTVNYMSGRFVFSDRQ